MKHIYLIRHGKPKFPCGKRVCLGRTNLPLCLEGFHQAKAMAELLSQKKLTVFSSPLIRAQQTAKALKRPVIILTDLQELDAGSWDGLTFDEIRRRYPELYAARSIHKTMPLPNAEPNETGLQRFMGALKLAVSMAPDDLAIVTHGGVLGLFLEQLTGTWRKPNYCEILHVTYENTILNLIRRNNDA